MHRRSSAYAHLMLRWRGGRSLLLQLRRALLLAAVTSTPFLLLLHQQSSRPPKTLSPPAALASSDDVAVDPPPALAFSGEPPADPLPALAFLEGRLDVELPASLASAAELPPAKEAAVRERGGATCATVETMGEEDAGRGSPEAASLRVRELIRHHFMLHGAARVRALPAYEFCKRGFVLGKASEAGFGNEMYKILTAAALSVMLNRSLIIGQTRGLYPFGEYISYTSHSFTMEEIKHLWRKNRCARKYGRDLNIRVDNFGNPSRTNALCSDWNSWKDPIIWNDSSTVMGGDWEDVGQAWSPRVAAGDRFHGTTDAVGIQFFLKNVHTGMRTAASTLFGLPDSLHARPNTFGELMRAIISPSHTVRRAVQWTLNGSSPHIVLHMRMMSKRTVQARKAAVSCIKRAIQISQLKGTPRVALLSDTPSFVEDLRQDISEFAEVVSFDFKLFVKNTGLEINKNDMPSDSRLRDWGPAPRWVALVDFFVASQARYAVVSGAHRRVGTTYAQLIAALAAANRHGQEPSGANFTFLSSMHRNVLVNGLSTQVGWGHVWNRYAGPLSCENQPHQCALTPLLPRAWWDGQWQSPIPRDVRRLPRYGVRLSRTGEVDERRLASHCRSRKDHVELFSVLPPYKNNSTRLWRMYEMPHVILFES